MKVERRIGAISDDAEMSRVTDEIDKLSQNIVDLLHEQVGDDPNSDRPPNSG